MRQTPVRWVWFVSYLFVATLAAAEAKEPTESEQKKKYGWFDTAELTYVNTSGNAEAETLGFRNTLRRLWPTAEFRLETGGLRAKSASITRFATGTEDDFRQGESAVTKLTAENYFLKGRYDHKVSERLFWFASLAWDRNEFAGINNRYTGVVGGGITWFDRSNARFRTDFGLTYTSQDDIVENPDIEDRFLGFQFGWEYWREISSSSEFSSTLLIDGNGEETDDFRANFTNSLTVSIIGRVALKIGFKLLFDNQPALVQLALLDDAGVPTDVRVLGSLDELDTVLTTALVITF